MARISRIECVISTHALREEGDQRIRAISVGHRHFYPRPPRGGRRGERQAGRPGRLISTHALREEGDRIRQRTATPRAISTHALREEGDDILFADGQETLWISTHALREEGDGAPFRFAIVAFGFLPTPSARRATPWSRFVHSPIVNFYPRPPRGGRLHALLRRPARPSISTHALREEGDW